VGLFDLFKSKPASAQSTPTATQVSETREYVATYQRNRMTSLAYKGDGDFELGVVGMNYRPDAVSRMLAKLPSRNGRDTTIAQLVREPSNRYDSNAIMVWLCGEHVGYVPAHLAEDLAPAFDRLGRGIQITCPAVVAWDPSAAYLRYIRLDVAYDAQTAERRDRAAAEIASSIAAAASRAENAVDLWPAGRASIDVSGESDHIDHIRRSVAHLTRSPKGQACSSAILVPGAQGRVLVIVGGGMVGYLEEPTHELDRVTRQLWDRGQAARALAELWCDGQWGNVRLDVAMGSSMFPINDLPAGPYAILPTGRAVQVTGEEEHLDVLRRMLNGAEERSAWATLHAAQPAKPTAKPFVEVRILDELVGRLTPATSAEFLPTIEHLGARLAVARAAIRGSALKVDVTLRAARAGGLPGAWIDANRG